MLEKYPPTSPPPPHTHTHTHTPLSYQRILRRNWATHTPLSYQRIIGRNWATNYQISDVFESAVNKKRTLGMSLVQRNDWWQQLIPLTFTLSLFNNPWEPWMSWNYFLILLLVSSCIYPLIHRCMTLLYCQIPSILFIAVILSNKK